MPIYNAFPEAIFRQDINGRTPFHRAFTVSALRGAPPAPHGTPNATRYPIDPEISVIQRILAQHPEVASIADNDGKLPFHSLAEFGERWDENVQCLYDAHRTVVSTRTNRESGNNLPIHLVASNPDAQASLVNKILELNPRGATLENKQGKLPLHLACESGISFDGGFESIYNAYPNAINIPEHNERGWMPLHFIVSCPNSTTEHIERVLNLHPQAANVSDGSNKTLLHLAIESGRDWENGLQTLFDANPDAIEVEDETGRIPLVAALLTYQNSDGTREQAKNSCDDLLTESEDTEEAEELIDAIGQSESTEDNENLEELHVSQINVLYHLLKSAPYVLHRAG